MRMVFWMGCVFEGGLVVVALALAAWLGLPLIDGLRPDGTGVALGVAGTAPPLLLLWWIRRSRSRGLVEFRRFLAERVEPLFAGWSVAQFAVLSVLAGFGEEMLFRGVLQPAAAGVLGEIPGWIAVSLLFGALHALNRTYFLLATALGLYLGWLSMWSGGLISPIVAHGLYDFLALALFLGRMGGD
ncbi:MAG TPA: CPBP family intramembrane glutamic endopeptidase [Methylomirabilota bacterium]|nr:CPBP family intramembrane glutamic endopeptidase [Methylomirabilota bacterium]